MKVSHAFLYYIAYEIDIDYYNAAVKRIDEFNGIPRGVMAHSTHVKGIGTYIKGIEKPRINVILATKISRQRCEKVNLGYMNPDEINISDYEKREDQGIVVVYDAGEILYRLTTGMPVIPTNNSGQREVE